MYTKDDRAIQQLWDQGLVVAVRHEAEYIFNGQWDQEYLREGQPSIAVELLMKSKYMHVEGWRMSVND